MSFSFDLNLIDQAFLAYYNDCIASSSEYESMSTEWNLNTSPNCSRDEAGRPECRFPNCNNMVHTKGFCRTHGSRNRCTFPKCDRRTQKRGRCSIHGGIDTCSIDNCSRRVRSRKLCSFHGGGLRCHWPDCTRASRSHGWCRRHSKRIQPQLSDQRIVKPIIHV